MKIIFFTFNFIFVILTLKFLKIKLKGAFMKQQHIQSIIDLLIKKIQSIELSDLNSNNFISISIFDKDKKEIIEKLNKFKIQNLENLDQRSLINTLINHDFFNDITLSFNEQIEFSNLFQFSHVDQTLFDNELKYYNNRLYHLKLKTDMSIKLTSFLEILIRFIETSNFNEIQAIDQYTNELSSSVDIIINLIKNMKLSDLYFHELYDEQYLERYKNTTIHDLKSYQNDKMKPFNGIDIYNYFVMNELISEELMLSEDIKNKIINLFSLNSNDKILLENELKIFDNECYTSVAKYGFTKQAGYFLRILIDFLNRKNKEIFSN